MRLLVEALKQLSPRLPAAQHTFQGLAKLSPTVVLNQATHAPFTQLPFQNLMGDNLTVIEDKYRKLICVDWAKETVFKDGGIHNDAETFWTGVMHNSVFKDVAHYALTCLITPIRNATVERVLHL